MNSNLSELDQTRITLFLSLFRGRKDVYAHYWLNRKNNKSGYSPVYSLNKKIGTAN